MSDFSFLNQQGEQARPGRSPSASEKRPVADAPRASTSQWVKPRDTGAEKNLRFVVRLLNLCAVLGFALMILGIVGMVGLFIPFAKGSYLSDAVEQQLKDGIAWCFSTFLIGANGMVACMAFAGLIQLAIRAVHALEEMAAVFRGARRS